MATQKEIVEQVKALGVTLGKIGDETTVLLQTVTDLKAALANQDNASQELVDAVNAVALQAQVVDDKVPDAPVTQPNA